MPTAVSYPGVYIEEIPSGVHTITGVATSITAFVGTAKRGPINKAIRCLGFADFERRFGGLNTDSELSYALRQFFQNGGSEAWVVRLAKNAIAASQELVSDNGDKVVRLTALDQGSSGNDIAIRVDYQTDNPGSTFNLSLSLVPKDGAGESVSESFRNLSMNTKDPRYVETIVTGNSNLVKVERLPLPAALATKNGISESDDLSGTTDFTKLIDDNHNTFQVAVDGQAPVKVVLDPAVNNTLAALKTVISAKLPAGVTIATQDNKFLVFTSGSPDEFSSVRLLPGETKDVASRLKVGPLFGGTEIDAVAFIRPKEMPDHATLTSSAIAASDLDNVPSTKKSLKVILDGYVGDITLDGANLTGSLNARLTDLAARLEDKVRASKPANPAFRSFIASVSGSKLVLKSGTHGNGSTIDVRPANGDTLATDLHLTVAANADTSEAQAVEVTLAGGNEQNYTPEEAYNLFIADRSERQGIFALEEVDLFNLLVLPGVTDPGILVDAAAYCQERRAFLIVDSPHSAQTPDEMEQAISGTALPKTSYAAVYYPWIKIADPLNGGRLRTVGPGGTVAGLYARTDSARGVWKAPAGTEAALVGVQGVDYVLTDRENGVLNPRGANCIRLFPVFGPVAWGARTLQGDDQMASEWKYIPVRRLALFLEESLYRGTKWAVFEPNDEPLWAQIRLNLGAFMHTLFRQGAFQGQTPKDAYFVKCDRETTTQNDINLGIVNILVGFAPLKPAEFVIIKIQQMAGQIAT